MEINAFNGRIPDLLFVREENRSILSSKAHHRSPDLAFKIALLNDRPLALRSLEAEYRTIEVQETLFFDQRKLSITVLRKGERGYERQELTEGELTPESLGGLTLPPK